jgi:hypothetical protein
VVSFSHPNAKQREGYYSFAVVFIHDNGRRDGMAGFYLDDPLGYLGLALVLFLIVYILLRMLTHRSH